MFKDKKILYFLYLLLTGILLFLFIFLLIKLFPLYNTLFSSAWKILFPFFFAALIAYLLYPIINKLHSYNYHKGLTILIFYLLFFGGNAILIYLLYPAIIHQLQDFSDHLPQLFTMYEDFVYQLYESTSILPEVVHDQFDELISKVETLLEGLLAKLVGGFTKIVDLVIFITVVPVLVFYILKDFTKIKNYVSRFVPKKHRQHLHILRHAIDEGLGSYIRGQLLVSLSVSIMTLIIFKLLNIKYALLLAIIMGLTNIIPYFGPIIGALPAIAITITESTQLALFAVGATLVIQLIESNLIAPYIVGRSTNIHPIAIIFALLLGGQIGGVVGMILAVPGLTIIKIIISHILLFRRTISDSKV